MGVDYEGLAPKSPAGVAFRVQIWQFRPLVNFLTDIDVLPWLDRESGVECAEASKRVARKIGEWDWSRYFSGDPEAPPLTERKLRRFAEFLRSCGGYRTW